MSRTVKRVPLDFDHPTGEIWPGYIRKGRQFPPCPGCRHGRNETIMDRLFPNSRNDSTGLTREAYAVSSTFYPHEIGGPLADVLAWHDKIGQAEVDYLVSKGRLHQWRLWDGVALPEPYEIAEGGWPIRYRQVRNDRPAPTAEEVNATQHATRTVHDGINRGYLIEFRCERLGIPMACPTCKGRCVIADDAEWEAEERAAEAWEPAEPPLDEGWQLWETTSEGSPQSPVFASAEELADWCAANADPFAGMEWTRDQWYRFISEHRVDVASMVVSVGGGPLTTIGTEEDTAALATAPRPIVSDETIAEVEALERDREYRDHWKPMIIRMLGTGKDGQGEPLADVPEWAKDRYRSERDMQWP